METILGSLLSPAKNSPRKDLMPPLLPISPMKSLSGSSLLIARRAVGAVNKVLTLYSSTTRQKVDAFGVPTGLPSKSTVVAPARRGA